MIATDTTTRTDIVVVGAGLAGTAAATVLARRGLNVTVVDPYAEFPPMFRAEKIEPDQAALLRTLGLFEGVQPATRLIREIIHVIDGQIVRRRPIEQFGIAYCDIVNSVRRQLPSTVDFRQARVEAISADSKQASVALADGARIECRLAIVATGMSGRLPDRLGLEKHMFKDDLSMAFGFMLERTDGEPFPFDAVTCRPRSTAGRTGYLTLFRMGQFMRGNLFAYWPARDEATREMRQSPVQMLGRILPGLAGVIGDYDVAGKVEPFKIDLYRMRDCALPGVVLIGDAYQSVCPSTGMGLTKVLTDVDVLCNECLRAWLAADHIGSEQTAAFYSNPRKVAADERALSAALAGRESVLSSSLHWKVRRRIRKWRFASGW